MEWVWKVEVLNASLYIVLKDWEEVVDQRRLSQKLCYLRRLDNTNVLRSRRCISSST